MQTPRCLKDENSVSFQIFLFLFSFITLGSESQISVFKQCQSNTQMSVFSLGRRGGGRACTEAKIWRKKNFIRHFDRFNFSHLSLAFISKYYPILHVVKR